MKGAGFPSAKALDAIVSTLPLASVGIEPEVNAKVVHLIRAEAAISHGGHYAPIAYLIERHWRHCPRNRIAGSLLLASIETIM
jgi:hypothetical protein